MSLAAQILHKRLIVLCDTNHTYKPLGSDDVTITLENAKNTFSVPVLR